MLEDFLEHEVCVAALFGILDRPLQLLDFGLARLARHVADFNAVGGNPHQFAVVDIRDALGVFHNRRCVAGQEILPFAEADHQRRFVARRDDFAGVCRVQHHNRVSSSHLAERRPHGRKQVAVVMARDQVR